MLKTLTSKDESWTNQNSAFISRYWHPSQTQNLKGSTIWLKLLGILCAEVKVNWIKHSSKRLAVARWLKEEQRWRWTFWVERVICSDRWVGQVAFFSSENVGNQICIIFNHSYTDKLGTHFLVTLTRQFGYFLICFFLNNYWIKILRFIVSIILEGE